MTIVLHCNFTAAFRMPPTSQWPKHGQINGLPALFGKRQGFSEQELLHGSE